MPELTPRQTIVLQREGERIEAKPGEPFDFTDDEAAHLAAQPGVLSPDDLRMLESGPGFADEEADADAAPRPAKPAAKPVKPAGKGGNRAAGL